MFKCQFENGPHRIQSQNTCTHAISQPFYEDKPHHNPKGKRDTNSSVFPNNNNSLILQIENIMKTSQFGTMISMQES